MPSGFIDPAVLADQAVSVGATRIVVSTGTDSVAPLTEALTSAGWTTRVRFIGGRTIVTATRTP